MIRALLALLMCLLGAVAGEAQPEVPKSRAQIQLSFAPVVREVSPAVVNIASRRLVRERQTLPFFSDPLFQRFFEQFGERTPPRERVQNSLGSGVIVDPRGLIVTNNHVIEEAGGITVVLADRREFAAEVIATDDLSDVALLRIDPGDEALPALEFGDSDAVQVGDLVLAIGNPFGIGQSVTSGIISAKGRTSRQLDSEIPFLQTDAAVNPGNSGGALVTLDGRLVGINTAIFSRGGGSIGIGFAIPADFVEAFIRSVNEGNGEADRPWLGAQGQPVDAELARSLEMERPLGVLVNMVYPGSAADEAGLETGDIILTADGLEIFGIESLNLQLAVAEPGSTLELGVWRRGQEITLDLVVAPPPTEPLPEITRLRGRHPLAGLTLGNLSPQFARQLDVDMFQQGVIVLEVMPGSLAARLGFQPRDVLVGLSGKPVREIGDLAPLERGRPRTLELTIERGGRRLRFLITA